MPIPVRSPSSTPSINHILKKPVSGSIAQEPVLRQMGSNPPQSPMGEVVKDVRDFPGGPVAKTLSKAGGPVSITIKGIRRHMLQLKILMPQ